MAIYQGMNGFIATEFPHRELFRSYLNNLILKIQRCQSHGFEHLNQSIP